MLWAIHLEKKRVGGDSIKRRLRRERQNEVRRKLRAVAVAVQELGLLSEEGGRP